MTPNQLKKKLPVPAIAAACKVSRQAVHKWKSIPAEHCLALEQATGISRYQLRPDVYGKAEAA